MRSVKVAIIGAGTSGLSARREVEKVTKDYVVIDDGPLGTTCARVGCMPSKVLIQVGNDFHRRNSLSQMGIRGGESLTIDRTVTMGHVRSLRDRFVRSVTGAIETWQREHLIQKRAKFINKNTLDLGDEQIKAESIIIATGSSPVIPGPWQSLREHLVTTDDFFEMETLPESMAVIGLGVIGTELGQAIARLGVKTVGVGVGQAFGGLSDPEIQNYAGQTLTEDFEISTEGAELQLGTNKNVLVTSGDRSWEVDKVLVSVGRRPNVTTLDLDKMGIELDEGGLPVFDQSTLQIPGTRIFIAGDVNGVRPILHEAADEGRMAGYNSVREESQCFKRRQLLHISFTEPNIAVTGKSFATLKEEGVDFVTGEASFEGQGRAIVKLKEKGLLHVYGDRKTGQILGAELMAPDGEHLAHLLAWVMTLGLNVYQTLTLPFYHPVIEEGLRTALRDLASRVEQDAPGLEVLRCQDPPVGF